MRVLGLAANYIGLARDSKGGSVIDGSKHP